MEKSIKKLIPVLRQIADDAGYALVCNTDDGTRLFCIQQFNNVYGRLLDLDAELAESFAPLADDVSLGVIRISARDMTWILIDYLRKQRQGSFWGLLTETIFFSEGGYCAIAAG